MNCKDCKFWNDSIRHQVERKEVKTCNRVKMYWDCTQWNADKNDEWADGFRVLTKESKGDKAFVQDGSDYHAEFITMADFGCNQFEKK